MLATAADLDGLPPSQVNQRWLKNLLDGRAESQLTDVSHTPNEQLGFGPRQAPSRVRFDPDYLLPFVRTGGNPDFSRYGDASPDHRVVYLVHRREDVLRTETKLPAIICSAGENTAIVEEKYGMELSARDVDDT